MREHDRNSNVESIVERVMIHESSFPGSGRK